MKKILRVVVAFLVLCGVVFGAYLVTRGRGPAQIGQKPPHIEKPVNPKTVTVYKVAIKNNQPVLRPTEKLVEPGENPVKAALLRLIEQGGNSGLANPIPKGTRLLGVTVKNGLATVDFSREFRDNFTGGSEEEGLLIGATLKTLGQFPEIKQVIFLVEGKPLDSLGHLDLSGPQSVKWVGTAFGNKQ